MLRLLRNGKVIAVIIFIVAIIIASYVFIDTLNTATRIRRFYENPNLPSHELEKNIIPISLGEYKFVYLNGTIRKNIKLGNQYKIRDVHELIDQINKFLDRVGLAKNYSWINIRIIQYIWPQSRNKTLTYRIDVELGQWSISPIFFGEPIPQLFLSFDALTGAIIGYQIYGNVKNIVNFKKFMELVEPDNIKSDDGIRNILRLLGFTEEDYKLSKLSFVRGNMGFVILYNDTPIYSEPFGSCRLITEVSALHIDDGEISYIGSLSIWIYPLGRIDIKYRMPKITAEDAVKYASRFMGDELGIPRQFFDFFNPYQIYYWSGIGSLSNYYLVHARVFTSRKYFDVLVFVDPVSGAIHDYSIS